MFDQDNKVYVNVILENNTAGQLRPLMIIWEDGRKFAVTRVREVRRAVSMQAGGLGIRYTVDVGRVTTNLWHEEDRWFVERRG